jgi:hypothetical protein
MNLTQARTLARASRQGELNEDNALLVSSELKSMRKSLCDAVSEDTRIRVADIANSRPPRSEGEIEFLPGVVTIHADDCDIMFRRVPVSFEKDGIRVRCVCVLYGVDGELLTFEVKESK